MKYLSVCSGIEAATTAWHHLGWKPVAFSEVEPFPSAVLAHHWPDTPNLGDMTKYESWNIGPESVDLLVGGTPCQSFSVAGLRKGLRDPRGGLMLTYLEIAQRLRPRWVVWENVPGVLSSNGGRDFGAFLGALGDLGYGWAYRVLDAQWFGVAQRRRRVFVVGCLGDAASAAAVLFESESVRRDSPPSREKGQEVTPTIRAGAPNGGRGHGARSGDSKDELIVPVPSWPAQVAPTLNAHFGEKQGLEDQHALGGAGLFVPTPFNTTQITGTLASRTSAGGGLGTDFDLAGGLVPSLARCVTTGEGKRNNWESCTMIAQPTPFDTTQITSPANYSSPKPGDPCLPLARGAHPPAVAFACGGIGAYERSDTSATLLKSGQDLGPGCEALVQVQVDDPCHPLARDAHPPAVAIRMAQTGSNGWGINTEGTAYTLDSAQQAVAFQQNTRDEVRYINGDGSIAGALAAEAGMKQQNYLMLSTAVRRLTPTECERLQGFPDDHTLIPWRGKPADQCPDGPRYKALGNSMAVPVMRWIGERIQKVYLESLL